jgi:hypothetical protein
MDATRIKFVRREAERFLDTLKDYEMRIKAERDEADQAALAGREFYGTATITGTKESGALRRASLDLTRALAVLRRPM